MKFNGVPIKCGDLHFWTMVNKMKLENRINLRTL